MTAALVRHFGASAHNPDKAIVNRPFLLPSGNKAPEAISPDSRSAGRDAEPDRGALSAPPEVPKPSPSTPGQTRSTIHTAPPRVEVKKA